MNYSSAMGEGSMVRRVAPRSDLILGGGPSGLKLLGQIGRNQHTSAIPVIICSADTKALRGNQQVFLECGIHLLPKPFDIDELLRLVAAILRSRTGRPSASLRA
jgi:DNA-binding response OmpR family regulator